MRRRTCRTTGSAVEGRLAAVPTGVLLGLQGTTAFGSASLAFLRFTKGPVGATGLLSLSVLLGIAVPFAAAARRLGKADL